MEKHYRTYLFWKIIEDKEEEELTLENFSHAKNNFRMLKNPKKNSESFVRPLRWKYI